ncbi:MAG: GH32 C-terminal domain-containing protein [Pirellulaceae bacterium]
MFASTVHMLFAGPLGLAVLAMCLPPAQAALYSLADDFAYAENTADNTWSFRLDDGAQHPPAFPLLPLASRNANEIWGSEFPTPPMLWSENAGYWGIGQNLTGEEQFSSRNDLHWAPNEVLLHPKGGVAPSGLVVAWMAPDDMLLNIQYSFGLASPHSSGIGYRILKRGGGVDTEIVVLNNIGSSICNELNEVSVSQGDQLFFRFNTAGDATGDIVRVAITIKGISAPPSAPRLAGAIITAGSDFTFTAPSNDEASYQWFKDGQLVEGVTTASLRIRHVEMAKAGSYTVHSGAASSNSAILTVTPASARPAPYASPVPRQLFSENLAEQEEELKTNALMLRFAASRKQLASDRYRPAYHFVSPENMLNDPNGLCFWQGRWHLFYQAYPPDEFPNPQDIKRRRQHWGHAVSADLVHWRDLPYAIYPDIERMCFSGSTVVEADRVVAFYPGIGAGQMVAIADDPLLLNWDKIGPVNSGHGDSDIWKENGKYFGLVGRSLWVSDDLEHWEGRGEFLASTPFIGTDDDGACPNFEPIGDKHILLFFSHTNGGQYFLGDYTDQSFKPYAHGRLNHGQVAPGGVHAPSAASDGNGGVINILNINDARQSDEWDQIMSVSQHLTLGTDKLLRIEPIAALATLRGDHWHVGRQVLAANQEIVLDRIQGNTLELAVEIDPQLSRWVQLNVLRSPNAEEQTSITFYNFDRQLTYWYHCAGELILDGSRSSMLPDVWLRPPEQAVLKRDGELLKLRVFIDRSVVEVFANGRQYLAMRVYPGRQDSVGVSIRAQGQDAVLNSVDAWQLQSIWPTGETSTLDSHGQLRSFSEAIVKDGVTRDDCGER